MYINMCILSYFMESTYKCQMIISVILKNGTASLGRILALLCYIEFRGECKMCDFVQTEPRQQRRSVNDS